MKEQTKNQIWEEQIDSSGAKIIAALIENSPNQWKEKQGGVLMMLKK